jgi:hypothetical protein
MEFKIILSFVDIGLEIISLKIYSDFSKLSYSNSIITKLDIQNLI